METLSGEATLSSNFFVCTPSSNESTLKGKNLLPIKSKFFPVRVDSFSGGHWCVQESKQEITKVVSLVKYD